MKLLILILSFFIVTNSFGQYEWRLRDGFKHSLPLDSGLVIVNRSYTYYRLDKKHKTPIRYIDTNSFISKENKITNYYYFFDFTKKTLNVYTGDIVIANFKIKKIKIKSLSENRLEGGHILIKCVSNESKRFYDVSFGVDYDNNLKEVVKYRNSDITDGVIITNKFYIYHKEKTDD